MEFVFIVMLFLSLFLVIALYFWYSFSRINEILNAEIHRITESYPDNEYRYFYNGHPYFWVNVSLTEFKKVLKPYCSGNQYIPMKPIYSFKVDQVNSCIFFALGLNDFDFNKLSVYEQKP